MDTFNTNENKAVLWDILNKKGIFNGYTSKTIHPKFEKLFNQILNKHYNAKSNLSTMALNKEFLSGFVKIMREDERVMSSAINKSETLEKIYDTNQIRKDMVDDFNKEFTNKQNEFQETIRLKRPDELDFADKNDEEPMDSTRIDELLKQQLEKRNLDIPKINETSQEFKNATDWISNSSSDINSVTQENNVTHELPAKVVSFKDDLGDNNNIKNTISELSNQPLPQIQQIQHTHKAQQRQQSQQGQQTQNRSSLKNGLLNNDALHKKLDEVLENQRYIINSINELLDRR